MNMQGYSNENIDSVPSTPAPETLKLETKSATTTVDSTPQRQSVIKSFKNWIDRFRSVDSSDEVESGNTVLIPKNIGYADIDARRREEAIRRKQRERDSFI
jgi:hypothetical protein